MKKHRNILWIFNNLDIFYVIIGIIAAVIVLIVTNISAIRKAVYQNEADLLRIENGLTVINILLGFLLISAIIFLTCKKVKKRKNPDLTKEKSIEEKDERNLTIFCRAAAFTWIISIFLLLAAQAVITVFGDLIAPSFILIGLMVLNLYIFYGLRAYFNKKM